MARRGRSSRLGVFLNARHVGQLERSASGAISFSYGEDWLAWSPAMPVSLSLPLSTEVYRGALVTHVFENLLPDADPVRERLAADFRADGTDAFSLLEVAGRDCVGALQFLPEGERPGDAIAIAGDPLSKAAIAAMLRSLKSYPLGMEPDANGFRISIAGAQDKTALLLHDGEWLRPSGATPTTHIFKPPIGEIHNGIDLSESVENEHLCLTLCRALGLPVAETDIARFEDQRVLVVKRFDRRWTRDGRLLRLPQEDFCQALSTASSRKYEKDVGPGIAPILSLLADSDRPDEDRHMFFRAQMVFWLLGATDGHAKNFSIAHGPGGAFRLTPLYDVLSAQPVVDAGRISQNQFTLAMALGTNNRRHMDVITPRHFQQTEAACKLPLGTTDQVRKDILAALPSALEAANNTAAHGVPERLIETITAGISNRADMLRT